MTAEVEVHGGGEVSSPKDLSNGKANADFSCVFVNGNRDVGSGDPVGMDLKSNSVESNGKQSLINNEENKFESEKRESFVLVSEGDDVDQENEHVNLSDEEGVLGDQSIDKDQNFEAGAESKTVVVNDDEVVPRENDYSENAESSHADLPADTACETGAVDVIHEIQVAVSHEELRADVEPNTEEASCPAADADLQLDSEFVSGNVVKESERGLDTGHSQEGASETVVDDLVDPSQETAELDNSMEVAESFPSQIDSENASVESVQTDLDVAFSVSDTTAKRDADFGNSAVTESSTSCEVDDVKRDTEVGKLNLGSWESSDSHPVDNSDVIEVENGLTGDGSASGCPDSDAKSEIETGFDSVETEEKVSILASDAKSEIETGFDSVEIEEKMSILASDAKSEIETGFDSVETEEKKCILASDEKSEIEIGFDSVETEEKVSILASDASKTKPEVSEGVIESVDEQPVSVVNAAGESTCTSDPVEKESIADVKAESKIENAFVVSCWDMPSDDAVVSESEVVNGSVTSSPDDVHVENGGAQSTGGESDDQRCKEVEESVEIQFAGAEVNDQRCKEVEENVEIQFTGGESDDLGCKEVEENGGIQFTGGESDDKTFQEVEENEGIQSTGGGIDDKACQKVEENGGIQFAGGESDDKTCQEVEENRGIKFTDEENDNKTCLEVKENGGIQFTCGEGGDRMCQEVEGNDENNRGETQTSTPGGSILDASESQNMGADVVKRPFYFLIKVPRYDDENIREQIKSAQSKVDEKTRSRDAIRDEIQTIRATYKEYAEKLEAAFSEERAARELLKSKRQYIDSILSEITKVKNAISAEDIDGRIRNMEHRIAHETLPLKEEKQFIRDIKQLKQIREQFSSGMGKQDEVQQAVDQKDKLEEQLKLLRKDADSLRENVTKAEAVTQAVKRKHREESEKLKRLLGQFKAADEIRQEAFKHLQSVKKQAYDKNKQFWMYKDDAKQANDLVFKGEREALQHLCVNQVERVLELWNNNDGFRKEYVNSNIRSTLRRLKTLDGRSLGPDEEAPVIHPVVNYRVAKNISLPQISALKRGETEQIIVPLKSEKVDDKTIPEVWEKRNHTATSKKPAKPSRLENVSATVSGRDDEIEEAKEEEPKLTKEEEEMAKKAEAKRKEEEAAKLREQRRLEEKAKAQEALERKKRIAEKAQARAALRAQKEAEQKEKEREKRARKKEKIKAAATEDAAITNEEESSESSETPLDVSQSSESKDKATKKPKKASQFTKQAKAKSIPLPLRNRSKRRMQSWMWVLIAAMVVFGLFLLGNSSSFSFRSGLEGYGS